MLTSSELSDHLFCSLIVSQASGKEKAKSSLNPTVTIG